MKIINPIMYAQLNKNPQINIVLRNTSEDIAREGRIQVNPNKATPIKNTTPTRFPQIREKMAASEILRV